MTKIKSVFICSECGAEAAKWIGKCPSCNKWNTYVEEVISHGTKKRTSGYATHSEMPKRLDEITLSQTERLKSGIGELDRVLGGGLIPGSLVLLGGEPGIGKSTLALQLALSMKDYKILYISGEESGQQIKLRAERIKAKNENCYLFSEINLELILNQVEQLKPDLVVVDSIQTLQSENIDSIPGSLSQIRECASGILKYAKSNSVPFILIGHITKDGNLAGPKILEHTVDTVLQFEGETNYSYRILRASKNRFGATSELGIFEMHSDGLIEVENPSEILLNRNAEHLSGVAVGATIDGIRPFLIEVQSLVSTAAYGMPQRITTGFDVRRLNMLLAVLEKRAGFKLATKDVFLNIAGGIRINDPGIDLAIISAILSSNFDKPLKGNICFAAEVGLSGEIRPVNRLEQRINEAARMGFDEILISGFSKKLAGIQKGRIKIQFVEKIEMALKLLFS